MKGRSMRCPYCKGIFMVSDWRLNNNQRFKCPHCHRYNEGSRTADEYGVLIGVSIEDLKKEEQ